MVHANVVNVECEMVLHVGKVPMLVLDITHYNKVTIIILHIVLLCVHSLKLSHVKLPPHHVMIALLDNVQILVIYKKLVNMLHSVGFITSLLTRRYSVDY